MSVSVLSLSKLSKAIILLLCRQPWICDSLFFKGEANALAFCWLEAVAARTMDKPGSYLSGYVSPLLLRPPPYLKAHLAIYLSAIPL